MHLHFASLAPSPSRPRVLVSASTLGARNYPGYSYTQQRTCTYARVTIYSSTAPHEPWQVCLRPEPWDRCSTTYSTSTRTMICATYFLYFLPSFLILFVAYTTFTRLLCFSPYFPCLFLISPPPLSFGLDLCFVPSLACQNHRIQ